MAKISKKDMDDLKAAGYVEGQPNTIPENISPVLRDQLVEEWAKDNAHDALDLPTAVDRGNQLARERAAAEEDGDTTTRRQNEAASGAGKREPFGGKGDHDSNGKVGGAKKPE